MERLFLWGGAVGGPLFVVAFLVEGATRVGYDPIRKPVSALALGQWGWVQQANFVVTGTLMLGFAIGLRGHHGSLWGSLLVGAYAVGLIGAGVFVTDPPGSPRVNVHGLLHNLFSLVVFTALPLACVVLAAGFARSGSVGWAIYSAASGVLVLAGLILFSLAFGGVVGLAGVGGLIQRGTILVGWAWLALLAVHRLLTGG
jgi:hypothetical protein